jgi:hypothetical protein
VASFTLLRPSAYGACVCVPETFMAVKLRDKDTFLMVDSVWNPAGFLVNRLADHAEFCGERTVNSWAVVGTYEDHFLVLLAFLRR